MDLRFCNAHAFASPHTHLSLFDAPSFDAALPPHALQPPSFDRTSWQQLKHDPHSLLPLYQRAIPPTPREDLAAYGDLMSDLWDELLSDGVSDCSGAACGKDAQLLDLIMSSLENEIISIEPAEQHSATSSPRQRGLLFTDSEDEWTDESV